MRTAGSLVGSRWWLKASHTSGPMAAYPWSVTTRWSFSFMRASSRGFASNVASIVSPFSTAMVRDDGSLMIRMMIRST